MKKTFNYDHLAKFNDQKDCSMVNILIPNMNRAEVVSVHLQNSSTPQNFHMTKSQPIVKFEVIYMPHDTSSGKKLMAEAKKLVLDVLKDDYEAKVATITQSDSNGENTKEIQVNDCIITGADVDIKARDATRAGALPSHVLVKFYLEGLLDPAMKN